MDEEYSVVESDEFQHAADEALVFAWSLTHESDPAVLLKAWSSPWSMVKEAVLANPLHPDSINVEASSMIRKPMSALTPVERILVPAFARMPTHTNEDWNTLVTHPDYDTVMEVVSNGNAPDFVLRTAAKRCLSLADMTMLLANPNTPYDVLLTTALKLNETPTKDNEYVNAKNLVQPLLRTDLNSDQQAILFPLLFARIPTPYLSERGYLLEVATFESAARTIIGNQQAPPWILFLLWEKINAVPHAEETGCKGAVHWFETYAVLVLAHHNCPSNVLTAACLSGSKNIREWAIMHPNCPDYARVAAVLAS